MAGLVRNALDRQGFVAKVRNLDRHALAVRRVEQFGAADELAAPEARRRQRLRLLALLAVKDEGDLVGEEPGAISTSCFVPLSSVSDLKAVSWPPFQVSLARCLR